MNGKRTFRSPQVEPPLKSFQFLERGAGYKGGKRLHAASYADRFTGISLFLRPSRSILRYNIFTDKRHSQVLLIF